MLIHVMWFLVRNDNNWKVRAYFSGHGIWNGFDGATGCTTHLTNEKLWFSGFLGLTHQWKWHEIGVFWTVEVIDLLASNVNVLTFRDFQRDCLEPPQTSTPRTRTSVWATTVGKFPKLRRSKVPEKGVKISTTHLWQHVLSKIFCERTILCTYLV